MLKVATWNDPRYGFATAAERLGIDSLWAPEAWAFDAFTPLAYVAAQTETIRLGTAIAQLGARTPAMLAMSALSMQVLSHGRFVLGLGTSGPQVMEGWHGVSFDKPIRRTRETIDTIRAITAGAASTCSTTSTVGPSAYLTPRTLSRCRHQVWAARQSS